MKPAAIITLAALSVLAAAPSQGATLCTIVADAVSGAALHQSGNGCDLRVPPASTFKLALSLIGFDSGLLQDAHSPALPFKPGYPDYLPSWRATTDPTAWMKNSVVWYSQQITAQLGEESFRRYITAFAYGNQDLSGTPGKHDGLSRAWLSSSLEISAHEQIAFLRKITRRHLPVAAHAYRMTELITRLDDAPAGWDLHGKTGTGAPATAEGGRDWDRAYGWFVGWATRDNRTVIFARLIQDDGRQEISAGLRARTAMVRDLPALIDAR
ncbi:class D beta-lactamase [Magnetospirillum sulfuroxidans]|nr:class D beta-lactamase [Magnetospirillum sulfuroxidans]